MLKQFNILWWYQMYYSYVINRWLFMPGRLYMSRYNHSVDAKIGKHRVILNICLWLHAASHHCSNSTPIQLCFNYVIHSGHKEIYYFINTVYTVTLWLMLASYLAGFSRDTNLMNQLPFIKISPSKYSLRSFSHDVVFDISNLWEESNGSAVLPVSSVDLWPPYHSCMESSDMISIVHAITRLNYLTKSAQLKL